MKTPMPSPGPLHPVSHTSGTNRKKKYPAVLIMVKYLFIRYPSYGGEIPESLEPFFPSPGMMLIRCTFQVFSWE
jgi:hypothetical protein